MIRRIIPPVKLVVIAAGIIFLFVPFCFSKEIASSLALPKITLPIAREDHAVLELSRYEIVNGETLLRRQHSIDYVNTILEYCWSRRAPFSSDGPGPVEFVRYERLESRSTGRFVFRNDLARQYDVSFFENTGEYEIRQTQVTPASVAVRARKDETGKRVRFMSEHLLSQRNLLRDLKSTVIIMKKGLAGNIAGGRNETLTAVLLQKYQVMKQNLERLFTDRENIIEVETAADLFSSAKRILSERKEDARLIIIDDGSLVGDLSPEAFQAGIAKGQAGTNYCLIVTGAAQAEEKMKSLIATQPALEADTVMPVVDMNAIAMMGLAILSHDPSDRILFEMAYLSFTGEPFVPSGLFSGQWIQWLVRAQPRMGRFDISKPYDQRLLDKLFEESA